MVCISEICVQYKRVSFLYGIKVAKGKGGPPASIVTSVNVPLNHNGVGQKERPTTAVEFQVLEYVLFACN